MVCDCRCLFLAACAAACLVWSAAPAAAQQGVSGVVLLIDGNQMPSPDEPRPAPRPVSRIVAVYELTHQNQATLQDGFFHFIATKKVAQTRSRKNGRFRIKLPPGTYSLFVREPQGWYANQWDGQGNIHPVTVSRGAFTHTTLSISHGATF
jgi:hypothetical protein